MHIKCALNTTLNRGVAIATTEAAALVKRKIRSTGLQVEQACLNFGTLLFCVHVIVLI